MFTKFSQNAFNYMPNVQFQVYCGKSRMTISIKPSLDETFLKKDSI